MTEFVCPAFRLPEVLVLSGSDAALLRVGALS